MAASKIAITIENNLLKQIDILVNPTIIQIEARLSRSFYE